MAYPPLSYREAIETPVSHFFSSPRFFEDPAISTCSPSPTRQTDRKGPSLPPSPFFFFPSQRKNMGISRFFGNPFSFFPSRKSAFYFFFSGQFPLPFSRSFPFFQFQLMNCSLSGRSEPLFLPTARCVFPPSSST